MTRQLIVNAITPEEIARRAGQLAAQASAQRPTWNVDTAGGIGSLHLYGVIGAMWGDVVASDVVPALRALDVAQLNVYVNSPGGDVYDGIAIRNAILQHPATVTVHVDGLAASAASFIATAGDEVVMGENAEIMIHDAWTIAIGNADDMRTVGDDLDRISDNIATMYAGKAGGTAADWRALMKAETWYTADEAVTAGLADRTAAPQASTAAAQFDLSIYAHAGRAAAPAPIPAAALAAPHREEPRMTRAQLLAALNAGTITQAQYDASITSLDAIDAAGQPAPQAAAVVPSIGIPGQPVDAAYAAGPAQPVDPVAHVTDRPLNREQLIRELVPFAQAEDLSGFVRTVNNALDPVVAGDDAGEAFLQPARIGQVWQARPEGRPVISSLGAVRPLTSTKIEGWKWQLPTPAPEPYAGDLAEIGSDAWETVPVSETPSRWAKGNRIDRIYSDLGSADLIASLFTILDANYDGVSDKAVYTDVAAGATALAGGATSILSAIAKTYLQLKKIGASPSKFWMAEDVFLTFSGLKVADLPAWLANATGFVNLADGSTSLASVFDVDVNFNLGAGGFLAYDQRAATVFESPKIKLEAQVIANGGIDIGWFAYGGVLVNDPRAIVKTTIVAA